MIAIVLWICFEFLLLSSSSFTTVSLKNLAWTSRFITVSIRSTFNVVEGLLKKTLSDMSAQKRDTNSVACLNSIVVTLTHWITAMANLVASVLVCQGIYCFCSQGADWMFFVVSFFVINRLPLRSPKERLQWKLRVSLSAGPHQYTASRGEKTRHTSLLIYIYLQFDTSACRYVCCGNHMTLVI